MKNFKILFIAFIVLTTCFHSAKGVSKNSDNNVVEDIRSSADSFGKAIDVRNYKVAKEQLDLLFPLRKK